ncbi:phosphate-starvation-inducible PsiE family protein [Aliiglaciecola sp. LCG003]|uniref:phosphate-starvation-inducible PsiE family protein n=1 Tax=Aliiglaciecola sp. LCG003 TaxID=3053655 RepID=UPI00257270BF|nr:phosphate-starvation-inducible PsiE family protein [Aliiglaciecola sp. LCG003]WJG07617.1 phosphate-starvation-inducible PsiE family protein [Aliiglaciecola sp. LCG003]
MLVNKDHKDSSVVDEPLIQKLRLVIRWSVRVLAVLMVFVIIMGVVDVGWFIYQKLATPPYFVLTLKDILATFGAFMAVLIAIEIFVNITIYLREDIIHVKIVLATALMAISRKVIILDLEKISAPYLWGIASIIFALSIAYWLAIQLPRFSLNSRSSDTTKKTNTEAH